MGVLLGVGVGVAVGVTDGVRVTVPVPEAVGVTEGVGVGVFVDDEVTLGVCELLIVGDGVPVDVRVAELLRVGDVVCVGSGVPHGVLLNDGVVVGDTLGVFDGVGVFEPVTDGVFDGLPGFVGVLDGVGVPLLDGVPVPVDVRVAELERVGEFEAVLVVLGVRDCELSSSCTLRLIDSAHVSLSGGTNCLCTTTPKKRSTTSAPAITNKPTKPLFCPRNERGPGDRGGPLTPRASTSSSVLIAVHAAQSTRLRRPYDVYRVFK